MFLWTSTVHMVLWSNPTASFKSIVQEIKILVPLMFLPAALITSHFKILGIVSILFSGWKFPPTSQFNYCLGLRMRGLQSLYWTLHKTVTNMAICSCGNSQQSHGNCAILMMLTGIISMTLSSNRILTRMAE